MSTSLAAFRRNRLKAAKHAEGLLAVGDGHVVLYEFGEAMDAQQVADGLDDHHDADGHHQHIAVERRIDDDGDCQHERHDGGNQHQKPAFKAVVLEGERALDAADAADHNQ